jgi:hypothetical protein
MKKFSTKLISSFTSYTVNTFDFSSYNTMNGNHSLYSSSVFVDNNSLINDLQRSIIFKSDQIVDRLISNKDLLNCLTETLELISNNGIYFHADLDIVTDDPNEESKLLLVYYPLIISNDTNISIQKELPDTAFNNLYRKVIRNLFKYSISIRKSVIIDEQFI